jgi:hypothetical protein
MKPRIFIAIAALSLLLGSTSRRGRPNGEDRPDGQLSGVVDSFDVATQRLTVLGITVAANTETIVEGGMLSAIKPGTEVQVDVVVVGNGVVATRIQLQNDDEQGGEH